MNRKELEGYSSTKTAVLALLVLGCTALTGCAGIPYSSEVIQGNNQIAPTPVDPEVVLSPPGPIPNAGPEQILRGFINAAIGIDNNYETARRYLVGELVSAWNPESKVYITDSPGKIEAINKRDYKVTITPSAVLNSSGEYEELFNRPEVELSFRLIQTENGQWRISEAPDGVVLLKTVFDRIFSSHSLYFFDSSYKFLVPELRWFPDRGPTATRITSALLEGPADWTGSGAILTAFPQGVSLSIASVVVNSGTARINLSGQVLEADQQQRSRMKAQLEASLKTVRGVHSVSIAVDGSELKIDSSSINDYQINPIVSETPLLLTDDKVGFFQGGTIVSSIGVLEKILPYNAINLSYSSSRDRVAVQNADGVYLITADGEYLIDDRAELLAPKLDAYGWVWSKAASSGKPFVIANETETETLGASWLLNSKIDAFELSRDGSKLAYLSRSGDKVRLYLSTVVRDSQGRPVAVNQPKLLWTHQGKGIDLSWSDSLTIAIVVRDPESYYRIHSYRIGGPHNEYGDVPSAVTIFGGNREGSFRILTADGILLAPRGQGWNQVLTGIKAMANLQY